MNRISGLIIRFRKALFFVRFEEFMGLFKCFMNLGLNSELVFDGAKKSIFRYIPTYSSMLQNNNRKMWMGALVPISRLSVIIETIKGGLTENIWWSNEDEWPTTPF